MSRIFKTTFFIALFAFFLQSGTVFSQTASISLSASPQNPGAGETVTLKVAGFSLDLNSARITWFVDGAAKTEGTGLVNFNIQAKGSGQSTAVRVVAETSEGELYEASKEIVPAGVDLIIEPSSYVPAFYKGKPLFSSQGTARVVAMPDVVINGKKISSNSLVFKWQKDGVALNQYSGTGKNSVTINGSIPIKDINVSVSVQDSSGNVLAEKSTVVSPTDPQILFYENNLLYGILFNKAITSNYYLGLRKEVKIAAKPYFFDIKNDTGSETKYYWSVNGNPVETDEKPNELILRQSQENLKGSASISLEVNNNSRIFQFANSGFTVTFGQ